MRTWLVAFMVMLVACCVRGDVLFMTWNMKWFPSGRADLRSGDDEESATLTQAARIVAGAVAVDIDLIVQILVIDMVDHIVDRTVAAHSHYGVKTHAGILIG